MLHPGSRSLGQRYSRTSVGDDWTDTGALSATYPGRQHLPCVLQAPLWDLAEEAALQGVTKRTAERWTLSWMEKGLIVKTSYGEYKKIAWRSCRSCRCFGKKCVRFSGIYTRSDKSDNKKMKNSQLSLRAGNEERWQMIEESTRCPRCTLVYCLGLARWKPDERPMKPRWSRRARIFSPTD